MTRDLAQVKPQSNAVNVWHSACMCPLVQILMLRQTKSKVSWKVPLFYYVKVRDVLSQKTLWPSQWSKIYFFYYIPWDYYTIFSFLDHSDSIAFEEFSMEVNLIGFWASYKSTYYIKLRTENSRDLMRIFCFKKSLEKRW